MNMLIIWGIALAIVLACVAGIVSVTKSKRYLPGHAMPLQDVQQVYDPGTRHVMEIQVKEQEEEKESGQDRDKKSSL